MQKYVPNAAVTDQTNQKTARHGEPPGSTNTPETAETPESPETLESPEALESPESPETSGAPSGSFTTGMGWLKVRPVAGLVEKKRPGHGSPGQ